MTEDSLTSPWIMFEAGAISKVVGEARVCPIVFGIAKTDLVGPLAMFQAIEFNKVEFRQLLTTINNAAKEAALPERNLDEAFNMWWPELERKVAAISSAAQPANSGPHRKADDLLRENLEVTRILLTEFQKLVQVNMELVQVLLTPSGLTDVQAVVRALRGGQPAPGPADMAEMAGYVAGRAAAGLTAKSNE